MKLLPLVLLVACLGLAVPGCYATKIVTVPMRLTGAVISIVPFVGNTAHDAIDGAAETVDDAL